MDSWYVRNWSVWLDLYLLLRTVKVVLGGKRRILRQRFIKPVPKNGNDKYILRAG
jgi:hypothetical protein